MPKKATSGAIPIIIVCLIVLLGIGIAIYFSRFYCDDQCKLAEYKKGYMAAKSNLNVAASAPIVDTKSSSGSYERDLRVLMDPLHPPVNRTDSDNWRAVKEAVGARVMYVSGRGEGNSDSYRLVGYLKNNDDSQDSGGNSWKLFARQIDRSGRGEFYMTPTNNNYDVKIPIHNDMMSNGYRINHVDDIPKELRFNTPLLNNGAYNFVEIPKADLQHGSNYI